MNTPNTIHPNIVEAIFEGDYTPVKPTFKAFMMGITASLEPQMITAFHLKRLQVLADRNVFNELDTLSHNLIHQARGIPSQEK